jgi:hypothetical protein
MIHPEKALPPGWCPQQDYVPDGKRYYRCSVCNRRLWPRMVLLPDGEAGWRLPPHKPKGYKIKKKPAR